MNNFKIIPKESAYPHPIHNETTGVMFWLRKPEGQTIHIHNSGTKPKFDKDLQK